MGSHYPTSNLTTQPCQIKKTSNSTTREHLTSNPTTRQAPTSKSLCHVQNQAFGHISTKRKIHIFLAPIPNTKTHERLKYWAFYALTLLPLTSILPSPRDLSLRYNFTPAGSPRLCASSTVQG